MTRKNAGMASAIPGTETRWGLQDRSMMSPLRTSNNGSSLLSKQPRLATAHAKLITHVLGLLNYALGEHRQSTQSETPQSLLRSIKLCYILPALLHSQDGRMKRRERVASAKHGDLTLLLPWLMEYTRRTSTMQNDQAHEETDADMLKSASSACRHRGGVTVAACSFLPEPRAPGNEETWERVKANFPEENQACVSEAAEAAVAASSSDQEEGGPNWRPVEEFDPQVPRSSILATRYQAREATVCAFRTCSH